MIRYSCPTCGKITQAARREDATYRPFCSHRCRMIDLGKWLNEEYRVSEPLDVDRASPPDTDLPAPAEEGA